MLVSALVSLVLHNLMRLHDSQCFHCVKTYNVHKTRFKREKPRFAQLTSFLLKNALNRKEKLVLALISLTLHNSRRLHVSQCFHCVKTDNGHKTFFSAEYRVLAQLTSFLLRNAFKRREMVVLAPFSLIVH